LEFTQKKKEIKNSQIVKFFIGPDEKKFGQILSQVSLGQISSWVGPSRRATWVILCWKSIESAQV